MSHHRLHCTCSSYFIRCRHKYSVIIYIGYCLEPTGVWGFGCWGLWVVHPESCWPNAWNPNLSLVVRPQLASSDIHSPTPMSPPHIHSTYTPKYFTWVGLCDETLVTLEPTGDDGSKAQVIRSDDPFQVDSVTARQSLGRSTSYAGVA